MTLDLTTLLVISGLVVVLCGLSFILNTAMRRNDPTGRVWSVSYIGAMLTALCYAVWGVAPDLVWIIAIGNGAYVFGIGAIWAGCRVFNGRRSLVWVPLIAAAVVVLLTALMSASEGEWAGSIGLFAGVVAFAFLTGFETTRLRMRRNLNARVLSICVWVVGAFYLARLVVFIAVGPDDRLFQNYFGSAPTSCVTILLIVLGTISISILQAERSGARALGDVTVGVHSTVGLLSAASFEQQWEDWVERASYTGDRLSMIAMDVDNLPQMNTAFGRTFGDTAIRSVAQLVRHHSPTSALLGHPGAGRFVVVVVTANASDAERLAITLQTALVDEPIDPERSLRATASFGVVDTDVFGYDIVALRRALDEATVAARDQGGNSIVVARATTA